MESHLQYSPVVSSIREVSGGEFSHYYKPQVPTEGSSMIETMEYPVGLALCNLSMYSIIHNIAHMEVRCYEQFSIEYCTA